MSRIVGEAESAKMGKSELGLFVRFAAQVADGGEQPFPQKRVGCKFILDPDYRFYCLYGVLLVHSFDMLYGTRYGQSRSWLAKAMLVLGGLS